MPRSNIRQLSLGLCAFVLLTLFSHALASDNPLRLRRYSLNEGLSQGTVSSVVQDSQGFLWIGTQDGLNRFDGYRFRVFRRDDQVPGNLSSDYIHDLHLDDSGVLWVGTSMGLNRFDRDTETFSHFRLGAETREHIGSQYIEEIYPAEDGKLWLGTLNGLYLFDPKRETNRLFKHQPTNEQSLGSAQVYEIQKDSQGRLWLGTQNGLDIFDPETEQFEHIRHDPNDEQTISGNNITALAIDRQGMMWVATYSDGLNRLDPFTRKIERYQHDVNDYNSIGHNRVRALLFDSSGQLWVGSRGGISIYNAEKNHFNNHRNDPVVQTSLSNNHIRDIYEDNNGSIWFATDDGLNQFVKSTRNFGHNIKTSTSGVGISHKRVRSLHKGKDGTVWVGVDNGLNRRDPNTGLYTYYPHIPGDDTTLTRGLVMSVLEDSKGRVWAGTYDGGFNLLLDSGKFRQFKPDPGNPDNSLSNGRVYSIMEDREGYIWLGTLIGLNRFDPRTEQFVHYFEEPSSPTGLSQHSIYDTIQDASGDIWIATRNGGLNRLIQATGEFQRFEHDPNDPQSISHNRVFALYQHDYNSIWAATSNGLNKLDIKTGKFSQYNKKHGLLNKTVYAVTGDDEGFIWVSTNRGLARFDPQTEQFKSFTFMHGLQSDEYNNGAFFKASDGELFFGGINGFNRFYPDKIEADSKPPDIAISQFYLANEPPGLKSNNPDSPLSKVINYTKQLTLTHKNPVFSFEFTALHFVNPQRNQYAYMLEGFNEQWINTSADHRRATYTNIPPGDYTFKVKAANSYGVWNEQPKQVAITVKAAPWLTPWAYMLYTFIVCGTIAAFAYQHWQKQKAISESENRLSLSLWSSGNKFWDWDLATGTMVRSDNSGELNMLPSGNGFTLVSLEPIVHPEDFLLLKQAFEAHANNQTDYFECAYRLKDEKQRWTWVLDRGQIVERDEHGNPLRALGTVQNIDDLKMIEAELRLLNEDLENRVEKRTAELANTVQSLETANIQLQQTQEQLVEAEKMAALGGLVSGIAHEINTPVGICITGTSVLTNASSAFFDLQQGNKLTLNDFLKFKQTCGETLHLIAGNLEKTAQLVQSFKMVSVQQTTDEAVNCNINQLFDHIVQTRQALLDDMNITVVTQGAENVEVTTHKKSLELVLDQLIENSLQHGFANDEVGQIQLNFSPNGESIHIDYSDNGRGLEPEGKEKLFEPFYTTRRGQGHLGLGMHIVYNHVTQRLKGGIEVHSNDNGLAYRITLPK